MIEETKKQIISGAAEVRPEKCRNCKGTGKQVFHGYFESFLDTCNFCNGTGKYEDELKWFKRLKA